MPRFALRCALVALAILTAPASLADDLTPQQVADRVIAFNACARRDSAAALQFSGTLSTGTQQATSREIIDWKNHRGLTVRRVDDLSGKEPVTYTAIMDIDGMSWMCMPAPGETTCAWDRFEGRPAMTAYFKSLYFQRYNDIALPNYGGAQLALESGAEAINGAKWKLALTPPGGTVLWWYIADSGEILAGEIIDFYDFHNRTTYTSRRDVEGCQLVATSQMETLNKDRPRSLYAVSDQVFLDQIDPATFSADQPVTWPE